MLEAGADPDFVDNEGTTPIYFAIKHGKQLTMDALMATASIDLNREDIKGVSLVALALRNKRN